MLAAFGALVEMQGIVRMTGQICTGGRVRATRSLWSYEGAGGGALKTQESGHCLVEDFENIACSPLLEILPQIGSEVA